MFDLADSEWFVLFTVLVTSFAVCAALILTTNWHGRLSLDHDTQGVQKLHDMPVPRIGGLAIAAGLIAGGVGLMVVGSKGGKTTLLLMACALPAFGAGLIEDLTKRVSVRNRLLASFASGALAIWVLGAQLTQLHTPGLDLLMALAPVAMLFTCFAVGGVTNSVNIIDGLNGLASGSVVIMLGGLGAIAWMAGDHKVLHVCLVGMAAIGGFMLLNYPFGKIFLGDGGAYLAGFWLAECAVLLLVRNPSVSTWGVLLVCFYPVWETAFSMYRRNVVHKVSSGVPDCKHLHHLILQRIISRKLGPHQPAWVKHGLASPLSWMLVLGCQGVAIANYQDTIWLVAGVVCFVLTYQMIYRSVQRETGIGQALQATPETR